jgi:hypothetical protein
MSLPQIGEKHQFSRGIQPSSPALVNALVPGDAHSDGDFRDVWLTLTPAVRRAMTALSESGAT